MESTSLHNQPPEQVVQECLVDLLTAAVLCEQQMPALNQPAEPKNINTLRSFSIHLKPHVIHYLTSNNPDTPFFRLVQQTGCPLPIVLKCTMTAASEILLDFYNNYTFNSTNSPTQNKIEINHSITTLYTTFIKHIKMTTMEAPELTKALDVSLYCTHLRLRAVFLHLAIDSYNRAYQKPEEAASQEIVGRAKKYYYNKLNEANLSLLQGDKQCAKLPMSIETVGQHHPRCVLQHLTQLGNQLFCTHEELYPADQDFHTSWGPAPKTRQCKNFMWEQLKKQHDTKFASTPYLDHSCEKLSLAQLKCYPVSPFVDEETGHVLPLDLGNE